MTREGEVKLATYRSQGREKIGVADAAGLRLFDLAAAARREGRDDPTFASMLKLIDAEDTALDRAGSLVAKARS
jgi:hypothetical protein